MIYELRIYDTFKGKLPDLHRRFSDHTMKLFIRHGVKVTAFWENVESDDGQLIYVCAFEDQEAMQMAWDAFRADPEWEAAKAASELDGELVANITSITMTSTPYSPDLQGPES